MANTQWVKLTRIRYGITENAIKSRLSDFGTVLKIRHEKIHGIGISVYSVKIDLKQPIPSRITIAQSPVNVFYRGQVQQCFRCEQTGHLSRNCPRKPAISSTSATVPVITAPVTSVPGAGVSTIPSTYSFATVSLPISDNALTSVPPVPLPLPPMRLWFFLSRLWTPCRVILRSPQGLLPGKIPNVCARMLRPLHPRPRRTRLCLLFLEYEQDRSRCLLLKETLTAEDLQRSTELLAQIPLDVLSLYRRFFSYRHANLVSPEEIAFVLDDFLCPTIPVDFVGSFDDPLLNPVPRAQAGPGQPALPDLSDCATSYRRHEFLQQQLAAEDKYDYVHEHLDPVPIQTELDLIPDDVSDIHFAYFVFFHPEYYDQLDDDEQTVLLERWTNRDYTSLY